VVLARQGARDRKRSGDQQPSEAEAQGSGMAIVVGALLDSAGRDLHLQRAILAMVAGTMISEAFERTHLLTGLITALGFLVALYRPDRLLIAPARTGRCHSRSRRSCGRGSDQSVEVINTAMTYAAEKVAVSASWCGECR